MNDPYGVFRKLKDMYLKYYETPFDVRDEGIAKERRALLDAEGNVYREPFIEAVPRFVSSGKTVAEACQALHLPARVSEFLTAGLFNPKHHLHLHQWQAFAAALAGRHVVVTSGTGSGKTEGFLLPILASLAQEADRWPASPPAPATGWWDTSGAWVPQRAKGGRRAAVRALILYPMNALVEDQLQRLRRAVDGPHARKWYKGGNRIYFGRYTSRTPVPGRQTSRDKLQELRAALRRDARTAQELAQEINTKGRNPDDRFFFPQLDGGEMLSRWDMQAAPPDILITNYSMLNVMLMRDIEDAIFAQTRVWLAENPENVFTLVVDELHMYRGTGGSEVALLLRNLLMRLGLDSKPL